MKRRMALTSTVAMESDAERAAPLLAGGPNPSTHQPLRATKSTAFKREERRRRKDRKRQERFALDLERWEPLGAPPPRPTAGCSTEPDMPWPCDPTPSQDPAGASSWSWGPPPDPPPQDPAAASSWSWGPPADTGPQPAVAAAFTPHPQAAAVRSCQAFFEEHADDEEDEEEEEEEQEGGGNAARFFAELLVGDAGLRGFYEAEREKGQFLCLVCEGSGARVGKRFTGCAALVQHAMSVARTKQRLAHRAFADAVGRLLGWATGRTAPMPEGYDHDHASDRAENFDVSESVEMEGLKWSGLQELLKRIARTTRTWEMWCEGVDLEGIETWCVELERRATASPSLTWVETSPTVVLLSTDDHSILSGVMSFESVSGRQSETLMLREDTSPETWHVEPDVPVEPDVLHC